MEVDIMTYPEGFEKIRDEELGFLPEDKEIRDGFMMTALQWLIQW